MEVFSETSDSQPELLAYHHSQAGNARDAIFYWEKAGQRAAQRSALVEAIDHYTKAQEILTTLPESPERARRELTLLLAIGSPLMSVYGYASPEVERTYARARELTRTVGGEADLFNALQGLWQFYYVRGMLPTSRKLGEELLNIARHTEGSTFLVLAHRAIASSSFLQGDYETCWKHTQEGLAVYDIGEHGSLALRTGHDPGVAHGVYLAWALWMLGYPDQSIQRVRTALDLASRLDHPLTTAYALCFTSLMHNHRGEYATAADCAGEALGITIPKKFALWTAWAKMQRGWSIAGQGNHELGIRQMKEGLEEWRDTGARVGFTFFPVTLAEMCLRAGRLEETARLLDEATPMITDNDEHFYEPELYRLKGELALRLASHGASEEALAHYRKGAEVAARLNGRSWELRLAMSHAQLLASQGEHGLATPRLEQVYRKFREGHETADLHAARAQLEALKSG
jgi:predicted ATPase